ncbi:class IV lanthionine synthetase LanL [Streptomyces cellostaticus]|uniref:class IV lanthionine synthetase LanL n=1 Tax=Streptomyces cellostaticus TaxID=67285 RepID=UPI001FC97C9F|nr:class IV lanthionine synthetase LanL [Streptomyces cellostaticus]
MAHTYQCILAAVLDRAAPVTAPRWQVRNGEFWCEVTPPRYAPRDQGWKLHVSATPASAPQVLERSAAVLVAHGCAFKFAADPRITAELVAVRADRARSGKFLTAYPADDERLRVLAEQLHLATLGLAGPAILSDRRYRPGSLVHYRYGCFARPDELNEEGFYEGRLRAPDGTPVPDRRNPWFSPPPWATEPFPPDERAPGGAGGGTDEQVLLAGRYAVQEAIRHSNRGGVYRAHDTRTGADVFLKEARPHVAADTQGKDARDWLRHEEAVLRRLAPRGITPAAHGIVETGGHLFLVEDLVDGTSLQRWALDPVHTAGEGIPVATARNLALDLARLVGEVHAAGLVLRDLKPGNVMMTTDSRPVLVDLECALDLDERAHPAGTQGFTDPAYLDARKRDASDPPPAPNPHVDCYSLGTTLLYALTGINPVLAPDSPGAPRPAGDRIAAIVTAAAPASPALQALAALVLGLTTEPGRRWTPAEATAFLRDAPATPPVPVPTAAGSDDVEWLLGDGLAFLADTIQPGDTHLWPRPRSLPEGDPCNVQLGAAGVLAVLDRAVRSGRQALRPVLRTAADWLDRRLTGPERALPGLYFGRSGAAWALHDAARTLDDPALASRAREFALRIPLDGKRHDICHGLAGAGLAQLHLWRATADERFAERAACCADGLLSLLTAARNAGDGVDWPAGAEHRDELAGSSLYGFGHGVAGNAAFLLAAGRDLHRPDLLDIAAGGGHALCAVARREADGTARWAKGPGRAERHGMSFWCNGTSGVGTFLIRLWQETGEPLFREYAEGAAFAVHRDRWRLGPGNCHGVSGNAQLLLDLAEATGEEHYRYWAAQAATCLLVRAARRDGRLLVPDDTMREVCASYGVGLAGALDFLLRLRHGGRRSWMVDDR